MRESGEGRGALLRACFAREGRKKFLSFFSFFLELAPRSFHISFLFPFLF